MTTPSSAAPVSATEERPRALKGWRELGFLAFVYAGYALTRVLASDAVAPARERARDIVDVEQPFGLAFERPLNAWFAHHDFLGTLAAFHYAGAHYLVTTVVLVWLFFRRADVYVAARRTLVIATSLALALYLLAPTAPPRMVGGFTDVLAQHSATGWWGGDASAPQGLGWMTNELAAFPSMHAGWALWVALVITAATGSRVLRGLAWAHTVVTAIVVIGTGNHWTLDIVVGWAMIAIVWRLSSSQRASVAVRALAARALATRAVAARAVAARGVAARGVAARAVSQPRS